MIDFNCPFCGANLTQRVQHYVASVRLSQSKSHAPAICGDFICNACLHRIQHTRDEDECQQCDNVLNCLGKGLLTVYPFLFTDEFFYKWISCNVSAVE